MKSSLIAYYSDALLNGMTENSNEV